MPEDKPQRSARRVRGWESMAEPEPTTERPRPTLAELRERRDEILAIARRHGASNVRVFGSVARDEARADSDIDLLVDLESGRSLMDLAELHLALEELLGRSVDVGTMVKPRLRDRVETEAVIL